MPPFLTGGEMIDFGQPGIRSLCRTAAQIRSGTVNGGGAVGLQAAIDYLMNRRI